MKQVLLQRMEPNKYYLLYKKSEIRIAKFITCAKLYKIRGRQLYVGIFEHISGEQKGHSSLDYECFELTEEEYFKHVVMEYV